MAAGKELICSNCKFTIEVWDDGNPYYLDDKGKKQYAHHPSEDFNKCIGNDSPYMCLDCGRQFNVDSEKPVVKCRSRKCKSLNTIDQWELEGKKCPYCKKGKLKSNPDVSWIS